MNIVINREMQGSILDIGGGGEGIIGRVYGRQVIAIDNRQDELDEAPDGFRKMLMDATCLDFSDEHFDHVTFFYSLMYMGKETQKKAISEAVRVLYPDGSLHIWDAEIRLAYPKPFVAELDIDASGNPIHTAYGIVKDDAAQDSNTFINLCKEQGLHLSITHAEEGHFYLRFTKSSGRSM